MFSAGVAIVSDVCLILVTGTATYSDATVAPAGTLRDRDGPRTFRLGQTIR
jgi:hypothetical protein